MVYKLFIYRNFIKMLNFFVGKFIWKRELNQLGISSNKLYSEIEIQKVDKLFNQHFRVDEEKKKIFLQNICKTYDNGYLAVNNFNLEIHPKEFVCLLGPSGCGKTSLLRMVAGLESINRGEYSINGVVMNAQDPSLRDTAMVFQNYALYPFMTVYNNIAFGLKLKTYRNNVFESTLIKYINKSLPSYKEIIHIKGEIKNLKTPFRKELRDIKILIKKNNKNGKVEQNEELKKKLSDLILKRNQQLQVNETKIQELSKKIKELIQNDKKQVSSQRDKQKDIFLNNKIKIKELNEHSKEHYRKYKNKIYHLKINEIREVKKKIRDKFKVKKNEIKKEWRSIKNKSEKNIIDRKKFNKNIIIFEKDISDKEQKISRLKFEIQIIKDKNKFVKKELKSSITGDVSIKNLVFLSSIWQNSIPYRVRKLSKIVGLENFLNRKPSELSGGQRQRVALLRAVSKDAQLFLFDEPLSNLDAKLRTEMRSQIRKIHDNSKASSLYVTHDQIEAMSIADKVVVMNLGLHSADWYSNKSLW